ncbi:MAG: hypothetical protein Q8M92_01715 [Candidatus Subteraquimicrobiales bacterium]|nr:hypothetical protein [Candidatus Subteraquimicrobiales bacterium]
MSKEKIESARKGLETVGRDKDRLLRELESKLIALASTAHGALSRKTIEKMEETVNEYYGRWNA